MALDPRTLQVATELIEQFEGVEVDAYLDPVGIPTICAGVTVYPNGQPVRMGDHCDKQVCSGYLRSMLEDKYAAKLQLIPGWSALGANRQAALLSFAWNLGADFYGAPGFETITRVLKQGASDPAAYAQMKDALALYDKAGGRVLSGLTERRKQEAIVWDRETTGVMKFIALQDTLLKFAPIDGKYLSDLGKRPVVAGAVVSVSRVDEIAGDSHAWFTLESPVERWAIYSPHWQAVSTAPVLGGSSTSAQLPDKIDWDDFSAPVGKYITVGEVLQYDARRKPKPGSAEEQAIIEVCREFDKIRSAWNGPLGVTSGYRPEPINTQVGGVPNSYHIKGMALDVYPIGESLEKFYQWLIKRWSGGFGDGRNKGFIHIDTRNGGQFSSTPDARPAAVWLY